MTLSTPRGPGGPPILTSEMHELSLAEGALDVALRHARRAGAARVVALQFVVGEFTMFEETSLGFYWERVSEGTEAAGSEIRVRRVPARFVCTSCEAEFEPEGETWHCPHCHSAGIRMTSGDECYLESIDVEAA
jgi:hydrogenase nickel incorporation protein HypA/HybF